MVFALSGCLLRKVQAQNLLQEALARPPLPASLWDVWRTRKGSWPEQRTLGWHWLYDRKLLLGRILFGDKVQVVNALSQ